MTMPHLMNCGHRDDGWCLDCVKRLGDSEINLRARVAELEGDLLAVAARPTTDLPLNDTGSARVHENGRLGCIDCGAVYGGPRFPDLIIDPVAFSKIAPNPPDGGLLCPNCINSRLEVAGLSNVSARFMSGPMCGGDDGESLVWLKTRAAELQARIAELEAIVGELTDTYEARKRSDRAFLEAARQSKERPNNDPTP